MSEEVVELQYRDDSANRNTNTMHTNHQSQKPKPKTKLGKPKSHSYEHVLNEDDLEASLGDLDAGQATSVSIPPPTSIIDHKIKDTGGYFLLSLYTVNFVAILSFMVAAFVRGNEKDLMMILILICVILTTSLSAYALFKYGRLQDQVDRLKEENMKFDEELISLKSTRTDLKTEVNDLENENIQLKTHSNELEDQNLEFTDLVDELKMLSQDGEDIFNTVDAINGAFDKMNDLVYQNERTHLLTLYYESAFRDKDNDMSKDEYERFLNKIPKKFRIRFQSLGSYEHILRKYECESGEIDLQSFLKMADDVLALSDDVLHDEFMRQYTVQKTLLLSQEDSNALRKDLGYN